MRDMLRNTSVYYPLEIKRDAMFASILASKSAVADQDRRNACRSYLRGFIRTLHRTLNVFTRTSRHLFIRDVHSCRAK